MHNAYAKHWCRCRMSTNNITLIELVKFVQFTKLSSLAALLINHLLMEPVPYMTISHGSMLKSIVIISALNYAGVLSINNIHVCVLFRSKRASRVAIVRQRRPLLNEIYSWKTDSYFALLTKVSNPTCMVVYSNLTTIYLITESVII